MLEFVRRALSEPSSVRCLIVYCVAISPLVGLGSCIAVLKMMGSDHPVLVVVGREPLLSLLLVVPTAGLFLLIAWLFAIQSRVDKKQRTEE